ncbi:MAG: Asp-tRNA(Asn)/Glu-tRNA(Gln) amidotransferase subunit GatC [Erysipelothrix sp.]|jgi:aspartyl-tRNA(Asn)/glutamyl-tRNA(Gln) amidotransferase subunit C|nr:Asp-tRNA(Asn)/Glu-tRNA(Gln) amidotransferase subunit GatC [Erysipelothrix sp.]
MDKATILALATELNFSLSEEEVNNIHIEFESLINLLGLLEKIDTTHVEPMVYPFEMPLTQMREDKVDHEITQAEALMNAHVQKEGYVLVPKVVK